MKVIEALKENKQTISFEFFPPKTEEQEKKLFGVIEKLKQFNPNFVSITCGALGTTKDKTIFWVKKIKQDFGLEPVAHLTCVAETRDSLEKHIDELYNLGVKNILALRGDPPEGHQKFVPPNNGFRYANQLVEFIKKKNPDFCIGVAGYPEKHRESESIEKDTEYLKQKVNAGADYVISQLFFEPNMFLAFLERCEKSGITVPILPGIMIITSLKQLTKLTQMCGASIPKALKDKLEKHQDDPEAIKQIGIDEAVKLCLKLKEKNIPGLHFFVMNQAKAISSVLQRLS